MFVDGTLNTGDLGYIDATGRIHIAGRAKDLIIRSGHNIDPLMIENAMRAHPAVALAAAVGMPDAYAGELPVCYVALRPGATVTVAELREHAERDDRRAAGVAASSIHVDRRDPAHVGRQDLQAAAALRRRGTAGDAGRARRARTGRARVEAREGGPRGMTVRVSLPATDSGSVARVQQALREYLFEVEVVVTSGGA